MSKYETARGFFEACDTGTGWSACETFCHADATFTCQAETLSGFQTLAEYADWMQGLLVPIVHGRYIITSIATDEARSTVVATAEFLGTHAEEGGPVAPTGKSVLSDYAYVMRFDGDKICHLTKIWNDGYALRELGWS
jgi:ketosteroid isomerase-like protein